ncbi:hypothetical protein [Paenibacillus sp.]|uniref:hypothetical protein n=1 Tax=Paenibacillus sp. TaxID=58172 RepID=UPI002D3722B8|nr:hypothetical protein [Paenibacillus sp.]HZG58337.1 hypothetical protein [Paenibacillus sp.]
MNTDSGYGRFFENAGIALAAAVPAGLLMGVILRVNMSIIAVAYPHLATGFHWISTLMIILGPGLGVTLTNAVIFSLLHNRLPRERRAKAIAYALFTLIVYGTPFLLSNPGGELFGPQAVLGVPLFALAYAFNGASLSWFADGLKDWVRANPMKRTRFAYTSCILLSVPALAMLGGIVFEIFTEMIPEIRNNW